MILADRDIKKFKHRIKPFKEENLQPNSYDLTLGRDFLVIKRGLEWFDLTKDNSDKYCEFNDLDQIVIRPHEFLLATTVEHISLPLGVSATVWGRSSIGRTGLFIHNAGLIDAGFDGQITLELFNASNNDIVLTAGMRIAQLQFEQLSNIPDQLYNGKYQGQDKVTGSKIHMDFSQSTYIGDSGLMVSDIEGDLE